MLDIQVRFVFNYFTGKMALPSRKDMLADMENDIKERELRGLTGRKSHELGDYQEDYYNNLSRTAGVDNLKPVIMKLYYKNHKNNQASYLKFRNINFRILNDDDFVEIN